MFLFLFLAVDSRAVIHAEMSGV